MAEFQKKADAGDPDFKHVLEEMETRKDLQEFL